MSYQALARTWRPGKFAELVGQEHVVKALVHALDDERLHHAYLFTGTRGVGKTTIARIFAKCLNCEQGVSSVPCGECSACLEIDQGRFVDLLEVDAASRTKVEDTRDLLDNVQYTPTRGRYKVYLIDEVHMLSGHSFNALLKTLEEPPPHVKFLLATTDPQRLPVTVLSRCLQFNLKRLPVNLIQGRLDMVCEREEIKAEPLALNQIAIAADGSVRDALSLLDQAAAFCEGSLTDAEVRAMLGTIDREHTARLMRAIVGGDAALVMSEIATLDERAPDYVAALNELATLIQRVSVYQITGAISDDLGDEELLASLAGEASPEDLQLFYQIALIGKRDLHLAPSMRAGFEMTLLRMMTFRPAGLLEPGAEAGQASKKPAASTAAAGTKRTKPTAAKRPEKEGSKAVAAHAGATVGIEDWNVLIDRLKVSGAARQLASHCALESADEKSVILTLDEQQSHMNTDAQQDKLRAALSKHFGRDVALTIRLGQPATETRAQEADRQQMEKQKQAVESIEKDKNVLAMQEAFGAEVETASIKPLDS